MKRHWLLLGTLVILLGSLGSEPLASQAVIPSILGGAFPKMALVGYRSGHFTPKGEIEYVAFFHDNSSTFAGAIHKVVVFGIRNEIISYAYECDTLTLPYPEWALDRIKNPRLNFGTWDGHCYVSDFNDNGLDEILFFSLTGMSFDPYIFEYNNGKMSVVLSPPPSAWNTVVRMETDCSEGKKYIMIWGSGETKASKLPWFKFAWDARKTVYAIVAKGLDDAP